MANANKTIDTRIQLKSDTEANWNKAGPKEGSDGFIPLRGELIIYSADNAHPFSRLKVGDGVTNVVTLPFIDSGTLNGTEVEIVKIAKRSLFPEVGSTDKLYVDLSNNKLYHYIKNTGYSELLNFSISATTSTAADIIQWRSGTITEVAVTGHTIKFTNGIAPSLNYQTRQVVVDVTKEDEE